MDPTPALHIRNLVKSYPASTGRRLEVLRIPGLDPGAGRQVALKGGSGPGKTTLLLAIAGILVPDSGDVEVGGTAFTGLSEARRDRFRAEKLGYIFQTFNLLQSLTALENVNLGLAFGRGADTRKAMEANLYSVFRGTVRLLPSGVPQGQAAILGAAALSWMGLAQEGPSAP